MKSRTHFSKQVVTAAPRDPIALVARQMAKHNVGAVVITRQDRPVGIITDRDLAIAVCADGLSRDTPAQEVMTCPITTIKESDGIFKATRHMMEHQVRRLPVVDKKGKLIGLVSLDDLLLLVGRELHNVTEGIRGEVAAV